MAKAKDPCRVVTPVARVSFPNVYEAKAYEDSEPKFSCTLLFKKNVDLSSLKKAVHAAKVKKWGSDETKWPKKIRSPFNDGDEKEDLDGYEGMIYITATNRFKPQVVDRKLEPIAEESGDFYAGCYAQFALRAFAYGGKPTPYKPGISFSLESIQKVKDGEPFSGRMNAEDVFGELDDEDGDDTSSDEDDSDSEDEDDDGGF